MFEPMIVGAVVGGVASALNFVNHYRDRLGPLSVGDVRSLAKLERTPIALATPGKLLKFTGSVGGLVTETSYYHRVPCVAVELRHYQVLESMKGPRRTLMSTDRKVHPFWVEDETGRVLIDPEQARIDFEVEGADLDSTVEEHRIRVGEKVSVIGVVQRSGPRLSSPMRSASTDVDSGMHFEGTPVVTWRTEPEVYPRLLPPVGGLALTAGSAVLAAVGSLLNF